MCLQDLTTSTVVLTCCDVCESQVLAVEGMCTVLADCAAAVSIK